MLELNYKTLRRKYIYGENTAHRMRENIISLLK